MKFLNNLGYLLSTTITLTRFSIPLARYFPSQKFLKREMSGIKRTDVTPFKITFSEKLIKDLRYRLTNTKTFTLPFEKLNNMSTINMDVLRNLISYWANDYDFQERERYINKYPHFMTNIKELNIHFIHVKNPHPEGKVIVPILCLHGWPNSIMEFYDTIPYWTAQMPIKDVAYEIIIPSLPGLGFSRIPCFSRNEMNIVLRSLMIKLFDSEVFDIQYGVSFINHAIMLPLPQRYIFQKQIFYKMPRERFLTMTECPNSYIVREDTLAIGLTESPIALAAFILQKYLSNTDCTGKYTENFKKSDYNKLIDNLMIYWATQSITTAMKVYTEYFTNCDK
ncbi:juvenile hormone epoxide hydrolase-like [Anoplolepis gracilipes]|uniref:juvenile hormone epoxide hydrolase-like n=1 Tax=Anoplolepis gracilipes TaxID=354296 RepID=UPI003BA15A7B